MDVNIIIANVTIVQANLISNLQIWKKPEYTVLRLFELQCNNEMNEQPFTPINTNFLHVESTFYKPRKQRIFYH